jgi:hypothetical protein
MRFRITSTTRNIPTRPMSLERQLLKAFYPQVGQRQLEQGLLGLPGFVAADVRSRIPTKNSAPPPHFGGYNGGQTTGTV